MNKPTKQLCVLHGEAEARSLESLLAEANIEVLIVRNQDTTEPGVSDRDVPWGTAKVSKEQFGKAKPLWKEWRSADLGEIGEAWRRKQQQKRDAESGEKNGGLPSLVVFILGLGVGALAMYVVGKVLPPPALDGWIEYDCTGDGITDVWTLYKNGVPVEETRDTNMDQKIDEWRYFAKGRESKYKSDRDYDGKVEEWGFCDDNGQVNRMERDLNLDGKIDIWEEYENGKYKGGEQDLDYDGQVDEWWKSDDRTTIERHWSLDGTGTIDKRAYYKNGIKTKELFDLDHDGEFETTRHYDRFEQEIKAEKAKP